MENLEYRRNEEVKKDFISTAEKMNSLVSGLYDDNIELSKSLGTCPQVLGGHLQTLDPKFLENISAKFSSILIDEVELPSVMQEIENDEVMVDNSMNRVEEIISIARINGKNRIRKLFSKFTEAKENLDKETIRSLNDIVNESGVHNLRELMTKKFDENERLEATLNDRNQMLDFKNELEHDLTPIDCRQKKLPLMENQLAELFKKSQYERSRIIEMSNSLIQIIQSCDNHRFTINDFLQGFSKHDYYEVVETLNRVQNYDFEVPRFLLDFQSIVSRSKVTIPTTIMKFSQVEDLPFTRSLSLEDMKASFSLVEKLEAQYLILGYIAYHLDLRLKIKKEEMENLLKCPDMNYLMKLKNCCQSLVGNINRGKHRIDELKKGIQIVELEWLRLKKEDERISTPVVEGDSSLSSIKPENSQTTSSHSHHVPPGTAATLASNQPEIKKEIHHMSHILFPDQIHVANKTQEMVQLAMNLKPKVGLFSKQGGRFEESILNTPFSSRISEGPQGLRLASSVMSSLNLNAFHHHQQQKQSHHQSSFSFVSPKDRLARTSSVKTDASFHRNPSSPSMTSSVAPATPVTVKATEGSGLTSSATASSLSPTQVSLPSPSVTHGRSLSPTLETSDHPRLTEAFSFSQGKYVAKDNRKHNVIAKLEEDRQAARLHAESQPSTSLQEVLYHKEEWGHSQYPSIVSAYDSLLRLEASCAPTSSIPGSNTTSTTSPTPGSLGSLGDDHGLRLVAEEFNRLIDILNGDVDEQEKNLFETVKDLKMKIVKKSNEIYNQHQKHVQQLKGLKKWQGKLKKSHKERDSLLQKLLDLSKTLRNPSNPLYGKEVEMESLNAQQEGLRRQIADVDAAIEHFDWNDALGGTYLPKGYRPLSKPNTASSRVGRSQDSKREQDNDNDDDDDQEREEEKEGVTPQFGKKKRREKQAQDGSLDLDDSSEDENSETMNDMEGDPRRLSEVSSSSSSKRKIELNLQSRERDPTSLPSSVPGFSRPSTRTLPSGEDCNGAPMEDDSATLPRQHSPFIDPKKSRSLPPSHGKPKTRAPEVLPGAREGAYFQAVENPKQLTAQEMKEQFSLPSCLAGQKSLGISSGPSFGPSFSMEPGKKDSKKEGNENNIEDVAVASSSSSKDVQPREDHPAKSSLTSQEVISLFHPTSAISLSYEREKEVVERNNSEDHHHHHHDNGSSSNDPDHPDYDREDVSNRFGSMLRPPSSKEVIFQSEVSESSVVILEDNSSSRLLVLSDETLITLAKDHPNHSTAVDVGNAEEEQSEDGKGRESQSLLLVDVEHEQVEVEGMDIDVDRRPLSSASSRISTPTIRIPSFGPVAYPMEHPSSFSFPSSSSSSSSPPPPSTTTASTSFMPGMVTFLDPSPPSISSTSCSTSPHPSRSAGRESGSRGSRGKEGTHGTTDRNSTPSSFSYVPLDPTDICVAARKAPLTPKDNPSCMLASSQSQPPTLPLSKISVDLQAQLPSSGSTGTVRLSQGREKKVWKGQKLSLSIQQGEHQQLLLLGEESSSSWMGATGSTPTAAAVAAGATVGEAWEFSGLEGTSCSLLSTSGHSGPGGHLSPSSTSSLSKKSKTRSSSKLGQSAAAPPPLSSTSLSSSMELEEEQQYWSLPVLTSETDMEEFFHFLLDQESWKSEKKDQQDLEKDSLVRAKKGRISRDVLKKVLPGNAKTRILDDLSILHRSPSELLQLHRSNSWSKNSGMKETTKEQLCRELEVKRHNGLTASGNRPLSLTPHSPSSLPHSSHKPRSVNTVRSGHYLESDLIGNVMGDIRNEIRRGKDLESQSSVLGSMSVLEEEEYDEEDTRSNENRRVDRCRNEDGSNGVDFEDQEGSYHHLKHQDSRKALKALQNMRFESNSMDGGGNKGKDEDEEEDGDDDSLLRFDIHEEKSFMF